MIYTIISNSYNNCITVVLQLHIRLSLIYYIHKMQIVLSRILVALNGKVVIMQPQYNSFEDACKIPKKHVDFTFIT